MTWVKVCGLTNRADTAAAAAAGADALGFVLVPASPRCITIDLAADLIEGVEQTTVLLTHDLDPEAAIAAALATGATGLQPYGRFAAEAAQAGVDSGLMVLRPVGPGDHWESVPMGQYPLFDSKRSDGMAGTVPIDFDDLPPTDRAFVVAGGLNPDTVGKVVSSYQPFGVDVSSGVETRPGQKDHALLSAFVAAVRGAA